MYGFQLENIINKYPSMKQSFHGIHGMGYITEIESMTEPESLYVIILNPSIGIRNRHTDKQSFKHWMLLYFANEKWHFFDPLGRYPFYYIKRHNKDLRNKWTKWFTQAKVESNIDIAVQAPRSKLCGLFVLFFFFYASKNHSFRKILNRFHKTKLDYNNTLVLETFNRNV